MDPNSHESPLAGAAPASQRATVNGPLNGVLRAASYNELNILLVGDFCGFSITRIKIEYSLVLSVRTEKIKMKQNLLSFSLFLNWI